jgi:hypothetical protein
MSPMVLKGTQEVIVTAAGVALAIQVTEEEPDKEQIHEKCATGRQLMC